MKPRWKAFGILTAAIVAIGLITLTYIAAMGYFQLDTKEVVKTVQYREGQELIVELDDRGDVEITSWENDDIKVVGIKKTYFGKDQLDKIELRVDEEEDVKITSFHERKYDWIWMDIKVHIPEIMNVSLVRIETGDIHVRGIQGETKLKCETGDIIIWSSHGNITAETETGDIWMNNQGKEDTNEDPVFGSGNFTFKTNTGDIWVKGLEHVVKAETSTGNVRVYECAMVDMVFSDTGYLKVWDCDLVHKVSGSTGEIDIKVLNISADGLEVDVDTGDIDITVPMGINASYEISTDTGSVGVDQDLPYEGSGSKTFKMGTINGGGPMIRASSETGNVRLKGE
ncbi:MAG: DUF4097 family beta strand repeat-containing protein [Thermoplasmatota archaeon]